MYYNVVCCNLDFDSLEELVSYSFSDKNEAEDCKKMLTNIYNYVQLHEVELNNYPKPHRLNHARLSLATGELTSIGFTYSYRTKEEINLMNSSYDSILNQPCINADCVIIRYSLKSEAEAERKCREVYNKCTNERTLVCGIYNSKVWVRNELLDDNLFYKYNDYLVNGRTGASTTAYQKEYIQDWSYLDTRCSG